MAEKRWTLINAETDDQEADFHVAARDFGISELNFSVRKRRLHGGLREGVDVVEIDNGQFRFTVLPTRGMGIWKAWLRQTEVGWRAPTRGPVHPQFVPLADPSGLGWLDGFDEWLVRCGLESNGAPEFDARGRLKYGLHGRIANLPANHVELVIDPDLEEIRLTGVVDETRFLFRQLQLRTTISTRFNRPGLTIRDEVVNLAAKPTEVQLLYHINFGSPLLDDGARFVAPVKTLVPRNAQSAQGLDRWQTYGGPQTGFAEQAYFVELCGAGETRVLLRNARGTQGACLTFDRRQLPCFTLWKNTGATADGYVTGLEPGTNYPNGRSFEGQQGRVVKLGPGEQANFDLAVGVYDNAAELATAEKSIAALQRGIEPKIFDAPQAGWTSDAAD
jgi:hypothetical protein